MKMKPGGQDGGGTVCVVQPMVQPEVQPVMQPCVMQPSRLQVL